MVREGSANKGDVLGVARIAAIQAAKRTADLIPLAHPLMLTRVAVEFACDEPASRSRSSSRRASAPASKWRRSTAVAAGLLTIYDMCKAGDRSMRIGDLRLLEKSGGRSGHYRAA